MRRLFRKILMSGRLSWRKVNKEDEEIVKEEREKAAVLLHSNSP
jgi:hypothetical protein